MDGARLVAGHVAKAPRGNELWFDLQPRARGRFPQFEVH